MKLRTCLILVLVSAGCGPGDNGTTSTNQDAPQPARRRAHADAHKPEKTTAEDQPTVDPWDALPEPKIDIQGGWLRVEAVQTGDAWGWRLNGKAVGIEAIKEAVGKYASVVNLTEGMTGLNEQAISDNVVVFSAPPAASSRQFLQLIELGAIARIWRFVAELAPSGEAVHRMWSYLPVDDGTDLRFVPPPEQEPEKETTFPKDEDGVAESPPSEWLPLLNLSVRAASTDVLVFSTAVDGTDPKECAGTRFKRAEIADAWSKDRYRELRKSLAKALLARQKAGSSTMDAIEIYSKLKNEYVPWGAVFLAMDAVDLANNAPGRGSLPKLFVTHKFIDARGAYGD
jgi:hypothetical protein